MQRSWICLYCSVHYKSKSRVLDHCQKCHLKEKSHEKFVMKGDKYLCQVKACKYETETVKSFSRHIYKSNLHSVVELCEASYMPWLVRKLEESEKHEIV